MASKPITAKSNKTLLTREGLALLEEELRVLKDEKRVEVAEKLKEAISYGDLSENSEYDDARTQQAQLELRIMEIEDLLKNYELIEDDKSARASKKKTVSVGHEVTIAPIEDGEEGSPETFKIVGSTESNILEGKLSNESPIGVAIIGHEAGEVIRGRGPSGKTFEYRIVSFQ